MANPEHLKILSKGVKAWNQWRRKHSRIRPDLTGTDLIEAKLREANLCEADLTKVNLSGADLFGAWLADSTLIHAILRRTCLERADLNGANLANADLSESNMADADLRRANLANAKLRGIYLINLDGRIFSSTTLLEGADLRGTNLVEADLSNADLSEAKLIEAKLDGADLTGAILRSTILAKLDLSEVHGLDKVTHRGPSIIDLDTFLASKGKIPQVFLRGVGVADIFVEYAASLANAPLEFCSCFISYSHADKAFARRLHDTLQGRGIRCWLDEHQLLPGDHIHREVDEAIRLWDKVLLCCSKESLTSWWVDKEISKALQKEEQLWKERGKQVLAIIPLNLDGHMFGATWQDWKKQHLKDRLAADFRGWETDNDKFEGQLESVVKALRANGNARERPPKSLL